VHRHRAPVPRTRVRLDGRGGSELPARLSSLAPAGVGVGTSDNLALQMHPSRVANGAFTGVPMLGNDGDRQAMLVAPDGTLVPDRRPAWFAPPAWAPRDPFARTEPPAVQAVSAKPVLLGGRYVVREAIRHASGGGVYRATDQDSGATVIIKQARPHTGSSLTGGDIRDLRRHEAAMLERFDGSGATARPLGLFEQQGELFLVQEEISPARRCTADPQPRVRRAPPGVRRRRPSRRSPSHWSISSRSCTPKDWCCGTSAPTT